MQPTDVRESLIIALDVGSADEALSFVDLIDQRANYYKIGLQLFTAAGPNIVTRLVNSKKKVFLDLKLHEIPNSVSSAIQAAADLGVSMITVHASGATRMMRAAAEAAKPYPAIMYYLSTSSQFFAKTANLFNDH